MCLSKPTVHLSHKPLSSRSCESQINEKKVSNKQTNKQIKWMMWKEHEVLMQKNAPPKNVSREKSEQKKFDLHMSWVLCEIRNEGTNIFHMKPNWDSMRHRLANEHVSTMPQSFAFNRPAARFYYFTIFFSSFLFWRQIFLYGKRMVKVFKSFNCNRLNFTWDE